MRPIEWLFPILRYTRLRREISGLRCAVSALLFLLVVMMVIVVTGFVDRRAPFHHGPSLSGGIVPFVWAWVSGIVKYVRRYWQETGAIAAILSGAYLLIGAAELGVALVFVRKRPGRRRPRCTWQTIKYVMAGERTWVVLILLWVLAAQAIEVMLRSYDVLIGLVALLLIIVIYVASPLLLVGAVAAQAANAVVAIQDDRACIHCGYFLIGLPSNRCPECGTEFDPADIAALPPMGDSIEREACEEKS